MRYVKEEIAKGRFEISIQMYLETINYMLKYNAPRLNIFEEINQAIGMVNFAVTVGIIDTKVYNQLRYELDIMKEEVE